jgi:hypothetical protein
MSTAKYDDCAKMLDAINRRIVKLRNAVVKGKSVRSEVIEFERWMRERCALEQYAPIRDAIEPFRFRTAITVSVSFYRNWKQYESGIDRDLYDIYPYSRLALQAGCSRSDDVTERWLASGGSFVGTDQHMMARKGSSIWSTFSLFGLLYPPFDPYFDHHVLDVSFQEAYDFGLNEFGEKTCYPRHEPEPDALTIDSEVVSLFADANRLTPGRVSPL